ncbi:hypothetical protein LOTGIDRAFT_123341 [Lottia gigantea]|uniref:Sulfatase N-terminal domain-containing protein n=1 Tax=Lottia gigantea TaxID=225164 RepID=V4BNT7_LOTGI|nr:hypothetical protein LOTGIDRAFT_123341 [Lottia gigantea]ESO90564.1 hypothetical protein LOTGIDRAFT_123341 [Lottia gigantea]
MARIKVFLSILFVTAATVSDCSAATQKNVLFIVADDLRPELPAFKGSDTIVKTPNLDKLAAKSLVLKSAYVQQSVCGPSRTSALTSRRPDTTLVYDLDTYWRTDGGGDFSTIPQYFKDNGYRTAGLGKLFHPGSASGFDDPPSWSDTYFHAPNKRKWVIDDSWQSVTAAEELAQPLPDTQLADEAIIKLADMSTDALSGVQPFFLSLGFYKPHLPFVFPEDYLNWYPEVDVSLPDNPYAPVDMPDAAWEVYSELLNYDDITGTGAINTTLPDAKTLELRRAYYATISYVDAQVGRVLDELERLGLENDTIIAFWGDHGFSLGEHGEWCKKTNFEDAVKAPLMLRVPGDTDAGVVSERLVEFVDLFPSIVEAASLNQIAQCPTDSSLVAVCTEGTSFIPLISDPTRAWKDAAFSQNSATTNGINAMGYTIKTTDFRYTEWVKFNKRTHTMNWNKVYDVELYDHRIDPEENINRASDSTYAADITTLSNILHNGWRNAVP